MRNDTAMTSFLRTNATLLAVTVCYGVCLTAVLLLGEYATALKMVMGGMGILAVLIFGLFKLVHLFHSLRESRGILTLSQIAAVLKELGIQTERVSDDQLRFCYQFGEVGWVIRYGKDDNRLTLGIAMQMDDPANAEIAVKGGNQVMSGHRMVRFYLRKAGDKNIFFSTIEMFISSLADFRKYIKQYLDLMVEAMQEHNEICSKLVEERSRPQQPNRIGFVSPMREQIQAFDRMNPNATEAERNRFIENLRK